MLLNKKMLCNNKNVIKIMNNKKNKENIIKYEREMI